MLQQIVLDLHEFVLKVSEFMVSIRMHACMHSQLYRLLHVLPLLRVQLAMFLRQTMFLVNAVQYITALNVYVSC